MLPDGRKGCILRQSFRIYKYETGLNQTCLFYCTLDKQFFFNGSMFLYNKSPFLYFRRLCNGDSSIRPASYNTDLKCIYLHYHHPYLRLGPFKYEPLNSDPHVGIFRDFYTEMESDVLRNNSHGKLHSTEYKVGGESRYYTSQRVSPALLMCGQIKWHLSRNHWKNGVAESISKKWAFTNV